MTCQTYDTLFEKWLMSADDFIGTVRASSKLKKHWMNCPECLEDMRFATVNTSPEFAAVSNEFINQQLALAERR